MLIRICSTLDLDYVHHSVLQHLFSTSQDVFNKKRKNRSRNMTAVGEKCLMSLIYAFFIFLAQHNPMCLGKGSSFIYSDCNWIDSCHAFTDKLTQSVRDDLFNAICIERKTDAHVVHMVYGHFLCHFCYTETWNALMLNIYTQKKNTYTCSLFILEKYYNNQSRSMLDLPIFIYFRLMWCDLENTKQKSDNWYQLARNK